MFRIHVRCSPGNRRRNPIVPKLLLRGSHPGEAAAARVHPTEFLRRLAPQKLLDMGKLLFEDHRHSRIRLTIQPTIRPISTMAPNVASAKIGIFVSVLSILVSFLVGIVDPWSEPKPQ